MPSDPPTIYATKVVGRWARNPGIVNVALGLDGFENEKAETVLRLALPSDTARALSDALWQGPEAAAAPAPVAPAKPAPAAAPPSARAEPAVQPGSEEAALQNALAITGLFAFQQLLTFAASDRMFAKRLPEFEKLLIRKASDTVTADVSSEPDAKAMRAAIESLEGIFEQVRASAKAANADKPGKW